MLTFNVVNKRGKETANVFFLFMYHVGMVSAYTRVGKISRHGKHAPIIWTDSIVTVKSKHNRTV